MIAPRAHGAAAPPDAGGLPNGSHGPHGPDERRDAARGLMLGALGVVFGDLGTSPLYTLQEIFSANYGLTPSPEAVLGVLSLVFWALVLVVCVKYLTLVLRADNGGEGGIMELFALAQSAVGRSARWRATVALLGIVGVALFYGDGVITPAISVLSAVEGLKFVRPELGDWIPLIAVVILLALFALQRFGTQRVSFLFAPIMCLWFVVIALLGLASVAQSPAILAALSPVYAWEFFASHGAAAFLALGGVVLAVTGSEALYADIGHFGKTPIRRTWFRIVLPALLLNYFGQGALLLRQPEADGNPFYHLVPQVLLIPMILLAGMAAIIASQAVISGAYSVTRSALRLGYLPRMRVVHTSDRIAGQVYVPWVNGVLMVLVLVTALGFRSSENLGAAYGIAETGTMIATTLLLLVVARYRWRWPRPLVAALGAALLPVDCAFFSANLMKLMHGGWFPLMLGIGTFIVMTTWHRGRTLLLRQMKEDAPPLAPFIQTLADHPLARLPGTAIFLSSNLDVVPPALWLSVTRFSALRARNVIVHVETPEVPYVPEEECAQWRQVGPAFWVVSLRFGFMQTPDVPGALPRAAPEGVDVAGSAATYFLSSEAVWVTRRFGMAPWRERLFILLARNTAPAASFLNIVGEHVVELGEPAEL